MRTDNFEQTVEPMILRRGRTFFRTGKVTECTDDNGDVQAVVQDSERYRVEMTIEEDGTLGRHSCTCPYEDGPVCKHEAAVLYYLRNQRKGGGQKAEVQGIIQQMKAPKKPLWEETIDALVTSLQTTEPIAPSDTSQPIRIRKERAYLSIERKAGKWCFSSNVRLDEKGTGVPSPCIIAENAHSLIVIELTPYEQRVCSTLLRLGAVPEEAEPKLRQFITAANPYLEIHSDLTDGRL